MDTKKITITHRLTGATLFVAEVPSDDPYPIRTALAAAVKADADLAGADLTRANLTRANLTRANLTRADLARADLARADLTRADLARADLARADLTRADLAGARLVGANLDGANLDGARLARARLDGARLVGANLDGANLEPIKADLYAVLDTAPSEVSGLLLALQQGRVDGNTYEGPCACLVGTIANLRGVSHRAMPDLRPNADRPAECWFMGIQKGATPENNEVARITEGWLKEWISAHAEAK